MRKAAAPAAPEAKQPQATFQNDEVEGPVELFYEETRWADFRKGQVHHVNTFPGHVWNVKAGGKIIQTWVMGEDLKQNYRLRK